MSLLEIVQFVIAIEKDYLQFANFFKSYMKYFENCSVKTTNIHNSFDNQQFSRLLYTCSAKSETQFLSLDYTATPEIQHAIPWSNRCMAQI